MSIDLISHRSFKFDLLICLLNFRLITLSIPIYFLDYFRITNLPGLYWKNLTTLFILILIYDLYKKVWFCKYLKSLRL